MEVGDGRENLAKGWQIIQRIQANSEDMDLFIKLGENKKDFIKLLSNASIH